MKTPAQQLKLVWRKIAQLDNLYFKSVHAPQGATVSPSYDYVGDGDPMHQLEIIRPEGEPSVLPVIVMVHGGGWVYGHKDSYYRYYAMELAKFGYAVISFNYRLAFDHPFPAMIHDIFSVLAWMETHAKSEKLDLQNVFLVGDSAGAHLSALTALIQNTPHLQMIYQVRPAQVAIKALGLSCGVYDFDRLVQEDYELPLKDTLMEVLFAQTDYAAHPLYPYASVSKQLSDALPAVYLVSSKADPLYRETRCLLKELEERRHPMKARIYAKKHLLPHVFNLKSVYPQSAIVNAEMIEYFNAFIG